MDGGLSAMHDSDLAAQSGISRTGDHSPTAFTTEVPELIRRNHTAFASTHGGADQDPILLSPYHTWASLRIRFNMLFTNYSRPLRHYLRPLAINSAESMLPSAQIVQDTVHAVPGNTLSNQPLSPCACLDPER